MMNVSDHQQRHLQNFKANRRRRRRRSLLNREEYEASNLNNSSMEVGAEYHAQELAAVPFVWESTPGTPKRHFPMINNNSSSLPPLTPPPSFQYQNNTVRKKQSLKDSGVNNLIQSVLPRLSIKRDHHHLPPRLSSSSSTKSSPSSSSSSSSSSSQLQNVVSIIPSPVQRLVADEEEAEVEVGSSVIDGGSSPVSALCFRRLSCFNRMFRGLQ